MRLTRNERKAIIIIAGALLLLNIGVWIFRTKTSSPFPSMGRGASPLEGGREEGLDGDVVSLFRFDPNTADSATFVRLGLSPRVARAIIHYRAAGGIFRKPQDFARIYTLSDEDFHRLLPSIYIKESKAAKTQTLSLYEEENNFSPTETERKGSLFPSKLHSGETVALSTADTAELKRIPGIGSHYSAKIVRYRERLGGFVSLSQLAEIEGLPENIARWFTLGETEIRKLPINTSTFGQLLRHPYLNFEQVQAIMNYRKAYGALHSLSDLRTYTAFTDSDFQRLQPYVAF